MPHKLLRLHDADALDRTQHGGVCVGRSALLQPRAALLCIQMPVKRSKLRQLRLAAREQRVEPWAAVGRASSGAASGTVRAQQAQQVGAALLGAGLAVEKAASD